MSARRLGFGSCETDYVLLFSVVFSSSGSTAQKATVYQLVLQRACWLDCMWQLRSISELSVRAESLCSSCVTVTHLAWKYA